MTRLRERPLAEVRASRQAQRLELTRVSHWRRLLRARIDLIVASASVPDPLGAGASEVPASSAQRDLPQHPALVDAVRSATLAELDLLGDLFDLDRRLARYEATVVEALGGSTDEVIRRLTMNPAASLRAQPPYP
ncbi:hypothetical protein [Pengzhenrongella sicca]|uniref:Uncharacterized protein n=1 Tax=Pengzhenrongella sicca TaxID=2819238 RepID=A0A8A4ZBE6_9MICO|nr:hypothetical protein [Pengzhenrongella sicca]QTE29222.1 hypothetical protein J4E96_18360 [Pengzhenrongella sicca]